MTFISWGYYALLLAALVCYYLLPHRLRWSALLAFSLLFSALLGVDTLLWMGAASIVSYTAALLIDRARGTKSARIWLWTSLALCFALLIAFKYLSFGLRIATRFFALVGIDYAAPVFSLAMPVGISFYVFQITGYLADVYRGSCAPVRHLGKYALTVSFFPKMMQGPIEPAAAFAAQLDEKKPFSEPQFRLGLITILLGIAQKTLVADRLASVVDRVYALAGQGATPSVWASLIAIVFYAFQLYADFAGYTCIALGSAQLFGLKLSPNFRQPYLAHSIADFWRRWHLTLSAWLRQNIYFPLGGSRVKTARWCVNVIIVFFVSGLWHGAGLNFIVWGLLHGIYQVVGKLTAPVRQKLKSGLPSQLSHMISIACTFVLVCFAWVFFRALNVAEASAILRGLFTGGTAFSLTELGVAAPEFIMCMLTIPAMIMLDLVNERSSATQWIADRPLVVRWLICLALLVLVILFGCYGSLAASSFIYVGF
ncbi:MAG: MBOAT family protein [Clostridia bacterium]|nr:MBOAT family protein [Clostridia bacterium]